MDLRLVLEAAALTVVFTKGSIFRRLREIGPPIDEARPKTLWQEFASCALCVGVWVGVLWRLLHAISLPPSIELAADTLASGAAAGVLSLVVVLLIALLDRWS